MKAQRNVLDVLQERACVNTVFLAVFTYGRGIAGRQIPGQPLPDHGKQEYDLNFTAETSPRPHPQYYKNTILKDTRAPGPWQPGYHRRSASCRQKARHESYDLSHSAGEKLARFLLQLAANFPEAKGKVLLKLTLTQEEIGQLIGLSRETVTRLLTDFRKNQWLQITGSTLIIKNKSALESFISGVRS